MWILTQTKMLVNTGHIVDIYADSGEVIAERIDHTELFLGHYITNTQAEDVIEKIAQSYGAISLFKMPKEEK